MDNFILSAFVLSGASGLMYEVVWTRALSVLVGGTALASQAVLATFFAGITAGAFRLGGRLARSAHGARDYARLEAGIAIAGLFSLAVLGLAPDLVAALTDGRESAGTAVIAFLTTGCACLPATFLMGATYPAATRALDQAGGSTEPSRRLGISYASNTAGAVVGAVLAAFVALPALGTRGTLVLAAAGNLAAAALAHRSARRRAPGKVADVARTDADTGPSARGEKMALRAAALGSGLAGISLQIVALRVLAVTLSDTVYTFALAVGAYILGAAAGAGLFARYRAHLSPESAPARVFAGAAVVSSLWLLTLRLGRPIALAFTGESSSFLGRVGGEALVALVLTAPIAIPTTWAFLSLARAFAPDHPAAGAGLATAWNGIGCALAPIVSALVLLPIGGSRAVAIFALAVLLFCALVLSATAARAAATPRKRWPAIALVLATALPLWFVRDGLFTWLAAPDYSLLWHHEGASLAVAVEISPSGQRRLRTNNNFTEGGDAAVLIQLRQGLLPTLFQPDARRVLVMGVGSGGTLAGVVAGLPDAKVDAVELVPEVSLALGFFDGLHGGVQRDPDVRLHIADARTFVAHAARTGVRYDLVVGDLFHAQQAGTGALYALEHFRNVRRALAPGGVYCQWLPLHETPPGVTPTIVRTFFSVFPHGAAFFGTWNLKTPILGLFGTETPLRSGWRQIETWLALHPLRSRRAHESMVSSLADTFATFIGDAGALRDWAGPGPFNSDDQPAMEFQAPRTAGDAIGIENVLALLPLRRPPDGLVDYAGVDSRYDNRSSVLALQIATRHFFVGSDAWRREDLNGAERELRAAAAAAPAFVPARRALTDLPAAWRAAGRDDRARTLTDWLATGWAIP